MSRIPILSLFIIFNACSKHEQKQMAVDSSLIFNVIILSQEFLNITIDNEIENFYVIDDLTHLRVYNKVTYAKPGIFPFIEFKELVSKEVRNMPFFILNDSSYVIRQNEMISAPKIDHGISSKFNFISKSEYIKYCEEKNHTIPHYVFTKPIYSLNKQKAYVQLVHSCGDYCYVGYDIFMEKVNGKWKILESLQLWIT